MSVGKVARTGLLALLLASSVWLAGLASSLAQDDECRGFDGVESEVCGEFLQHWERNGGRETFGLPLTERFNEIDSETHEGRAVQYFEHARLEHHPDREGTPWAVQSGRIGAEVLVAEGVDWREMPEADPDDQYYFDATGQAVAPEFQEYWSEQGLDLGNASAPYGGSIALFGYPLTPAEDAENRDGEEVRVQWFERARLEADQSGDVTAVPLGTRVDDDSDGLSIRLEREIDATVSAVFEAHNSPGLGVWIESPELGAWEWTEGHADFEAEEPYTEDTHHRIGSVTKTFVATLVLQLVDEGMLELDDTVEQWFPELDGAEDVTVRMLTNMTSGIFNYTESLAWQGAVTEDPDRVWEPEELLGYAFEMTETATPDGTWSYSNTNYVMLGVIIEDVTGNDVRDELEQRVLEPLGLEDTSFPESDETSLSEPYARGIPGNPFVGLEGETSHVNTSLAFTAGQMDSTASDLLDWLPELHRGELISEEAREERFELVELPGEAQGAGYGVGVLSVQGWIGHDGSLPGYVTHTFYRPDIETALVALTNSDQLGDTQSLATAAAFFEIQRILGREYPLPEE